MDCCRLRLGVRGHQNALRCTPARPDADIGTVEFRARGDRYRFTLNLDHARFTDHFLSMKEFKCLESPVESSATCPTLSQPGHGQRGRPGVAGAFAAVPLQGPEGFRRTLVERPLLPHDTHRCGHRRHPEAIDLNLISAPPSDPSIPPYGINERGEIAPDSRWFNGLSIPLV